MPTPEPSDLLALVRDVIRQGGTSLLLMPSSEDDKTMVMPLDEYDFLPPHPVDRTRFFVDLMERGELARPSWAVLATDTYMSTMPKPVSGALRVPPGSFRERFAQGDPTVTEAVSVYFVGADVEWMAVQAYTRAEDKVTLDFGNEQVNRADPDTRLQGNVPDVLRDLVHGRHDPNLN